MVFMLWFVLVTLVASAAAGLFLGAMIRVGMGASPGVLRRT
jgi:hypothetical protein